MLLSLPESVIRRLRVLAERAGASRLVGALSRSGPAGRRFPRVPIGALARHANVCALIFIFGNFLSCYSPQMAHYKNAQNLEANGRSDKAEEEYKKALAEDPSSPVVTFAFARFLKDQDRPDDALVYYKKFLELTKDAPLMYEYTAERKEAEFYVEKAAQEEEEKRGKKKHKEPDVDPDNPYGL